MNVRIMGGRVTANGWGGGYSLCSSSGRTTDRGSRSGVTSKHGVLTPSELVAKGRCTLKGSAVHTDPKTQI